MTSPRRALPFVVLAQLCATAVWFSPAAGARSLAHATGWTIAQIGTLSSATQVGFALGTLALALSGMLDRRSLTRIFIAGSLAAAAANAALLIATHSFTTAILIRGFVGVAMACVYPVGIRLALAIAGPQAPSAIAWLVAMLTLGTGSPNLALAFGSTPDWRLAIAVTSALALAGAALLATSGIQNPPTPSPSAQQRGITALRHAPGFWPAVGSYCGHMWEVYPLWALASLLAGAPALAFGVFVAGALACVVGGMASRRVGPFPIARIALIASLTAAVLYPIAATVSPLVSALVLLAWGAAAVPDSPHLSVLAARAAPPEVLGTAVALTTAIGFTVSAIAIQVAAALTPTLGARVAWVLAPGPLIGLLLLRNQRPTAPLFATHPAPSPR